MLIRIFSSCTSSKRHTPENQLTGEDFQTGTAHLKARHHELQKFILPAVSQYDGRGHLGLVQSVEQLRGQHGAGSIELTILSAGYGLIDETTPIAPYDVSFNRKSPRGIREMAGATGVPAAAWSKVFAPPADLIIVLLGEKYLQALQLPADAHFPHRTLFFGSNTSRRFIRGAGGYIVAIPTPDVRSGFGLMNIEFMPTVCGYVLDALVSGEMALDDCYAADVLDRLYKVRSKWAGRRRTCGGSTIPDTEVA